MPRALTASRVLVARGREADYVTTLSFLAARVKGRGEHLWLFRNPAAPGEFLEFSESASAEGHPTRRAQDIEELALKRRLEAIAAYAPGNRVLWEEVTLEER
jgi:hypothetical protein